jgi:hypothetical protein
MSRMFLNKKILGPCAAKDLKRYLSLQLSSKKFKITEWDVEELAPPVAS